jgi:hypothetical protein
VQCGVVCGVDAASGRPQERALRPSGDSCRDESTRGPRSSLFLFLRMPAPELEGQFDDAPIDKLPEGFRQQYNHIDDTSPELSDDISGADDDFDSEELDDAFARVEDEDWEIAERGGCSNSTLQNFSLF